MTTSPTPSQPTSPDRRSGQDRRLDQQQVGGDHYSKLTITPWEALEAWLTPEELRGYFKGEAIVYIAREMSKAGPLDISKARHVLQKLEEVDKRIADALASRAALGTPPAEPDVDACIPCLGKPCQRLDSCPFGLVERHHAGLSTVDFVAASQRLHQAMPTAGELCENLRRVGQQLSGTAKAAGSPAKAQTPAACALGCGKPAA